MNWIELVAQIGGIGAVFAVIMFWIYRHDREEAEKRAREDRKFMEDRMTAIISSYSNDCRKHAEAFGGVEKVLTELITWLKRKNGNS